MAFGTGGWLTRSPQTSRSGVTLEQRFNFRNQSDLHESQHRIVRPERDSVVLFVSGLIAVTWQLHSNGVLLHLALGAALLKWRRQSDVQKIDVAVFVSRF